MRTLFWPVGAIVVGVLVIPTHGAAQQTGWIASVGHHSFDLRDVSRHQRPVDASPVSWRGSGPSVLVQHERATPRRSHRFDLLYASTRNFSYASPLRAVATSDADRTTALDASYEYRRYPFRDLGVRGLDVGVGATTLAGRLVSTQQYSPSLVIRDRRTRVALGGVAAARLRRWRQVGLETWWVNGIAVARRNAEHSAEALSAVDGWGGGWYDEWWTTARVRLTAATSIVIEHALARDFFSTSHVSNTGVRRSILMGVAYAR